MEVVWATKCWPNRVFAFLLSISEVNCWLAETQFTSRRTDSMLSYRKKLTYELIENAYIKREELQEQLSRSPRRSKRLLEETGHGLVSVPPNKKFKDGWLVSSKSRTNARDAPEKSGHTAGVLLEYTCAAVAFPNMSLRRQIDCNAPVDSPFLIRFFSRRFGGS